MKRIFLSLGLVILLSTSTFALGVRPNFSKPSVPTPAVSTSKATVPPTANALVPTPSAPVGLSDDELYEIERAYGDLIKQKQFLEAFAVLSKVPAFQLSSQRKTELGLLQQFQTVEELQLKNTNPLFQKEDDLGEATKKTVQKLYREAQYALIIGKPDVSRDLLIHILFLNRRNEKARRLLEVAFGLKTGAYKVENMEAKYWDRSKTLFYAGNYGQSADALNVLIFFDKENPLVYERLGSSYYMTGEKRKAIESWNTALFFDPSNKELAKIVERTKQVIAEEEKEWLAQKQTAKKTDASKAVSVDSQIMGLYPSQADAYSFAAELKKRGMDPVVEETDKGEWAVKVPKSQLEKK